MRVWGIEDGASQGCGLMGFEGPQHGLCAAEGSSAQRMARSTARDTLTVGSAALGRDGWMRLGLFHFPFRNRPLGAPLAGGVNAKEP